MSRSEVESELLHSKNWADFIRIFRQVGKIKREVCNDSTIKFYGETGMVPVHNHPTQAPKRGTVCGILKMAKLAGILSFIGLALYLVWPYLG